MLVMRSREPSLHSVITTFLRCDCRAWTWATTASNTLTEPSARAILGLRLDRNRRAVEIVEQRVHLFLEQRQPVFHAGVAAALGDGFIEVVVPRRRAERRHIAHAEAANGFGDELEFRDRHEV